MALKGKVRNDTCVDGTILYSYGRSLTTLNVVSQNMVGVSATGSGKTLSFLLPGMIHINAQVSVIIS